MEGIPTWTAELGMISSNDPSLMGSFKLSHLQRRLLLKMATVAGNVAYVFIFRVHSQLLSRNHVDCPNCICLLNGSFNQTTGSSISVCALLLFLVVNVVKESVLQKKELTIIFQRAKSQVLLSGCPSAVLLLACNLSSPWWARSRRHSLTSWWCEDPSTSREMIQNVASHHEKSVP